MCSYSELPKAALVSERANMKNRFSAAMLSAMALITCIPLLSGCSTSRIPNQNQSDPNQNQNGSLSQQDGAGIGVTSSDGRDGDAVIPEVPGLATSSGVGSDEQGLGSGSENALPVDGSQDMAAPAASGLQSEQQQQNSNQGPSSSTQVDNADFEGLIATERDGFAIWSAGKLSVSSGGQNDKLAFEVNPNEARTRMWTNLGVDGSALISEGLSASTLDVSIARLGTANARNLSSDSAIFSALDSPSIKSQDIVSDGGRFAVLSSDASNLGTATMLGLAVSGNIECENIGVAEALASQSVESNAGRFTSLEAGDATVGKANLGSAVADQLNSKLGSFDSAYVGSLEASYVNSSGVKSKSIEADESALGNATANVIKAMRVNADSMTATSLDAKYIHATKLTANEINGVLSGLSVSSSAGGVAVFPEYPAENDALQNVVVNVPAGTDFVMVTPFVSDGGYCCEYEVGRGADGCWRIYRKYPASERQAMLQNGESKVHSAEVAWLAVDVAK